MKCTLRLGLRMRNNGKVLMMATGMWTSSSYLTLCKSQVVEGCELALEAGSHPFLVYLTLDQVIGVRIPAPQLYKTAAKKHLVFINQVLFCLPSRANTRPREDSCFYCASLLPVPLEK